MNNIKKISLVLLLSMGVIGLSYAGRNDCSDDCNTSNDKCFSDCNTSNDDCNDDCNDNDKGTRTVLIPRSITQNLTFRNNLTFYNRYHNASCNLFTWDWSFIYTQNRRERKLGAGFLGKENTTVAGVDGDINACQLGLGSKTGDFESSVCLRPRRQEFAWLNQWIFNLDCLYTGLWADVAFAVVHARHKLRFSEDVTVESDLDGGETTNVRQALDARNAFARDCKHTGVDDIEARIGYDWCYCANDHAGIYLVGSIPTGKRFNNARWFQPVVGSKHGGIGAGIEGDYTFWSDEPSNSDFVVATELKYIFKFRHREDRIFDLNNGPLSRFLLAAPEDDRSNPRSITDVLTQCVKVEPRHTIDWWVNFHYQWCNWGVEASYNLWWRDRERICSTNFDFDNLGIFDKDCGALTSNSGAKISDNFGEADRDDEFVTLESSDVNLRSGAARKALSHTVSVAFDYSNVWNDCYPWYVGVGGGYEFANRDERRSTFEKWNVYAKAAISF